MSGGRIVGWQICDEHLVALSAQVLSMYGLTIELTELSSDLRRKDAALEDMRQQLKHAVKKAFDKKLDRTIGMVFHSATLSSVIGYTISEHKEEPDVSKGDSTPG